MLPFDPLAVRVKILGMPIGADGVNRDGDGDGKYTAVPGGGDVVPVPLSGDSAQQVIEASFSDNGFRGQEYRYGDMEWEDADDTDPLDRIYAAYSDWGSWEGNFRQRYVSAALMGEPTPPAEGGDVGMPEVNEIIATGKSEGQPQWATDRAKEAVKFTTWMMQAADSAEPYRRPLYRGLANVPETASIFGLKPGDAVTMPLSAFTPNYRMATDFAAPVKGVGGRSAIIVLEKGAKGVPAPADYDDYIETSPGNWEIVPAEVVTLGDFEVVKTEDIYGTLRITLRHTATYNGENVMPNKIKAAAAPKKMPKIPRWAWTHLGGSLKKAKPPKK